MLARTKHVKFAEWLWFIDFKITLMSFTSRTQVCDIKTKRNWYLKTALGFINDQLCTAKYHLVQLFRNWVCMKLNDNWKFKTTGKFIWQITTSGPRIFKLEYWYELFSLMPPKLTADQPNGTFLHEPGPVCIRLTILITV